MRSWAILEKFLERPSNPSLTHPDFEPGKENLEAVRSCKILVVGAGGLGCELLKDLALMGFQDVHVIDMDTIDVSNLNRQFLFRMADVGRSKAEVAAEFIQRRIPECTVTPHCCRLESKDENFYRQFNIIVCGLDSVQARRWLNGMICGLLEFDDDGNVDGSSIIPMVDGGTEGFQGNVRIILPGLTPCVECELSLYPPQVNFPMCTIAHTPRLPEHCVEYVRIILWEKERPFNGAPIDGDDPEHIQWIYEQALERAKEFGISGVDYRLTQGVVKRIIPAVPSTNASIAALCAQEVFKLATNCSLLISNYVNFQISDGASSVVVELEKRDDCPVCSLKQHRLEVSKEAKLKDVIELLQTSGDFELKSPSVYVGARPLYVPTVPNLEEQTRPNLVKYLHEFGLQHDSVVIVADVTRPHPFEVKLVVSNV